MRNNAAIGSRRCNAILESRSRWLASRTDRDSSGAPRRQRFWLERHPNCSSAGMRSPVRGSPRSTCSESVEGHPVGPLRHRRNAAGYWVESRAQCPR
jgi:hypothetical protein